MQKVGNMIICSYLMIKQLKTTIIMQSIFPGFPQIYPKKTHSICQLSCKDKTKNISAHLVINDGKPSTERILPPFKKSLKKFLVFFSRIKRVTLSKRKNDAIH